MAELPDYYQALGVSPSATQEEIKAAQRAIVKGLRDVFNLTEASSDAAKTYVQRINDAYGVLSKPDKRAAYDRLWEQSLKLPEQQNQQQEKGQPESDTEFRDSLNKMSPLSPEQQRNLDQALFQQAERGKKLDEFVTKQSQKQELSDELSQALARQAERKAEMDAFIASQTPKPEPGAEIKSTSGKAQRTTEAISKPPTTEIPQSIAGPEGTGSVG